MEWSTDEGTPKMHEWEGDGKIQLDNLSPAEMYWAQFKNSEIDLMEDYYLRATNAWAKNRKQKAIAENKTGSWWNK